MELIASGENRAIKRLEAEVLKLGQMCDERGSNEARMFIRARELADQVGQLQTQNTALDSKLAQQDALLLKALVELQRVEAIMLRECGIGVVDRMVINAIKEHLE